jgi:hypothetical protein
MFVFDFEWRVIPHVTPAILLPYFRAWTRIRCWKKTLAFERRLTVSEDRRSLQVVERITGPGGQTKQKFSVPLA